MDILSIEKAHSSRGPSSASRWMNCTGSPNLIAKLGDKVKNVASEAASQGTAAHTLLLDICLRKGEDAWEHAGEFIEADGKKFEVDVEMQDGVQLALDWIRGKMAQYADKHPILILEQRVASPEGDDTFGSLDVGVIVPGERLIIGDFKYGRRVVVEPDDEQVRLYGWYTFETFNTWSEVIRILGPEVELPEGAKPEDVLFTDPNTVCELYIIQPRIPHPQGVVRRHVTNRNELSRFFYGEVLPAYTESFTPEAPLNMGDWCRWCPAMEFCPAINRSKQDMFLGDPIVLDNKALNDAVLQMEQIEAQGRKLRAELYRRAMAGGKFPDWKLVKQKADRIWKDGAEFELREKYGDAAFTTPCLKSPAQVEKLEEGKKTASKWAMKPDVGLTLAPRSDRRKEETANAMADFDKAMGNSEETE